MHLSNRFRCLAQRDFLTAGTLVSMRRNGADVLLAHFSDPAHQTELCFRTRRAGVLVGSRRGIQLNCCHKQIQMHGVAFLQDLAVVMIAAGLVTVLFHALKQPVVLGYILAGVLIGPHLFSLITDEDSISTLAELGVVFLLFTLGLEFNFRKIRKIGVTAFIVAPLETGLMFFAGFQIGRIFGWSVTDSIYLGCIMMISSTTLIAKTLADLGKTREKFAEVIFGILIAEDIIAILAIVSLSGVAMTGSFSWVAVLTTVGRLAIFLVAAVVLGLLLVPRFLHFVARFKSDETLLIAVVGLCFGLSLLAVKLEYSVALGAFIMGALISESDVSHKVERLTIPLRDLFSAMFFVAIGLLIDPGLLRDYALPVVVITAVLVVGKVLACSFGSFVAGYDRETSLRVGMGLAQIGEFSFIIAALGVSLKVTSHFLYPIAVCVSVITSFLTPYLIRSADQLVLFHDRFAPRSLLNYQRDYTAWIQRFRQERRGNVPRQMVRRMIFQLGINAALIAALFIAAVFVDQLDLAVMQSLPKWTGGSKAVLWLAALLLSLPIFVAALRKLQALAMLISEMAVVSPASPARNLAMRTLLTNTIVFAGAVGLALLVLLLSSALLPPWEILIFLVLVGAGLAFVLNTFLVRIYSRAQSAIRETLTREPPVSPHEDAVSPPLLDATELLTVNLPPDSPAVGKRLRELELRTRTGATAIVIKRAGDTITNPGPDQELAANDQLVLLGSPDQLQQARQFLGGSSGK